MAKLNKTSIILISVLVPLVVLSIVGGILAWYFLIFKKKDDDVKEKVFGCTEKDAYNYNANATTDDNSCLRVTNIFVDEGDLNEPYYNFFLNADGTEAMTKLYLQSGTYYRFQRLKNASTHPFYVSTPSTDITLEGDGSVSMGITGTESFIVYITPNLNTTELYFSCTTHSSMKVQFLVDAVEGCMDPQANNFNAAANVFDNSCEYEPLPLTRTYASDGTEITILLDSLTFPGPYHSFTYEKDSEGNTTYGTTYTVKNEASITNYIYYATNFSIEFRVNDFQIFPGDAQDTYIVVKYGTNEEYESVKELNKIDIVDFIPSGDGKNCIIKPGYYNSLTWYPVPSNAQYLQIFFYNFDNIKILDIDFSRAD